MFFVKIRNTRKFPWFEKKNGSSCKQRCIETGEPSIDQRNRRIPVKETFFHDSIPVITSRSNFTLISPSRSQMETSKRHEASKGCKEKKKLPMKSNSNDNVNRIRHAIAKRFRSRVTNRRRRSLSKRSVRREVD